MTDVVAKLADGTELRFPAGTADDVIDRVVQTHLTKPESQAPVVEAPQVQAPIEPQIGAEGNLTPQETPATQPTKYFQGKSEAPGDTSIADFLAHPIDTLTGRDKVSDQSLSDLVAGQEPSGGNRPFVASAAKGIMSIKSMFNNAYLSDMIKLMEKNYKDYGSNFEKAPPEKRQSLLEDQADLVAHLNKKAEYNKDVEAVTKKYGTDAFSKKADALEATPEYQNASRLKRFQLYGNEVISNPQNIPTHIATVSLESLPATIKVLLAATIMKFMGGGPSAIAIAGGQESAAMEYASAYVDLRQQGLPHKEAHDKAGEKSVVIGFLDAVSIKSAGKALDKIMNQVDKGIVKRVLSTAKETAKELNKQGMLGASGEILGSAVSGQNIDPRAALDEYLGELATGPLEALTTYRGKVADERAADAEPAPPGGGAPPGSGTPPPTTETPQLNVVTPEALLTHVETRFKELTEKANGVPAQEIVDENGNKITIPEQGAQPMTEQEISELKFLQEHQANPEKLAAGYGVTIGAPTVKGSQDTKGSIDELEGKGTPKSPLYQPPEEVKPAEPPIETTPPADKPSTNILKSQLPIGSKVNWTDSNGVQMESIILDKMAEVSGITMYKVTSTDASKPNGVWVDSSHLTPIKTSTPAEPEAPPTEEKPPVTETPPTEVTPTEKQPVILNHKNGNKDEIPTLDTAEEEYKKANVDPLKFVKPINRDKDMYALMSWQQFTNFLGKTSQQGKPNDSGFVAGLEPIEVTDDINKALPKNKNRNQVLVKFRQNTLSGKTIGRGKFLTDDISKFPIENFAIHNRTKKLPRWGGPYYNEAGDSSRDYFTWYHDENGNPSARLNVEKSEATKAKEEKQFAEDYIKHLNRPRGTNTHTYSVDKNYTPRFNYWQKEMLKHETVGSALNDLIDRYERGLKEGTFDKSGYINSPTHDEPTMYYLENKKQAEMYLDIMKHVVKIEPVAKAHLYMDPNRISDGNFQVFAFYNSPRNYVAMFTNAKMPTFIHEVVHAATVHFVNTNPNHPLVKKLEKLLEASRKKDKKSRGKYQLYGNTNTKEFLSEGFSNPQFIKHLMDINPIFETTDPTKAGGLWDNLKEIIREMIGQITGKPYPNKTAFSELMDISGEMFTGKTLEGYKYDIGQKGKKETTSSMAPSYQSIKAKPGVNTSRLEKILGPQLYGSPKNITNVSVKEMLQNSFDAIKGMLEKGIMDEGNIDIITDKTDRSIILKDDGSGMTPDVLSTKFFEIAGTYKETDFGSGGFGVAKMLFLYNNKTVEVITMRDGKISSFEASGEQLKASLNDPSQAPNIEVINADEYDQRKLIENFPKGHGTIVRVVVPETFTNQSTGKTEQIEFDAENEFSLKVLKYSPLFANINVTINNEPIHEMGTGFNKYKKDKYVTFVNAEFNWGTARIYVSKNQEDKFYDNMHILSNGLWQFSDELTKKPGEKYADNIPHRFYIDIVSKVKPDEQGYPFTFNRQGFTKEAADDLDLIKNYIWLTYTKKDLANTSANFGNIHYLTKRNGKINVSEKEDLNPKVEVQETPEGIEEGSNVKVIDGRLIVNGKEIPALSTQDLKNATIDLDDLKIPQDEINSDDIMVHDNLLIDIKGDFRPITELAKEKFGERFDQFMYEIGDVFKTLRDRVVYLNIKGELPNHYDVGYKDLANHAIGISFDKEYRGVSIKLPFDGMFINPALPEFTDPERAGFGFFGTMIHELAHFQVRNHKEEFPAEMQRLSVVLKGDKGFDLNGLEQELVKSVIKNKDILDYLNDLGVNYESEAIGQRFKDGSYERATRRTSQNISEPGETGQLGRKLLSNITSRDKNAGKVRKSKPIPSEAQEDASVSKKQTDTPAFKKWFGKSKIVNADGTPKLMYHGTAHDISEFITNYIFVTPDPEFANDFTKYSAGRIMRQIAKGIDANPSEKLKLITKAVDDAIVNKKLGTKENSNGMFDGTREGYIKSFMDKPFIEAADSTALRKPLTEELQNRMQTGRNIMPVYVKAENPFDFENISHVKKIQTKLFDKFKYHKIKEGDWEAIESDDVQDAIKSLGFDSFYTKENGEKQLAVFNSNQIKSTIGNRGTFDITEPEISKNVEPMTEEEAQDEQGSRQIFNYRGDPVDIREWEIPEQGRIASLLSKWFQYFADEDAVLTKIMNTLKSLNRTISDMTDIEKKQELKNSRISAQLMIFANEEVNPIVKEMKAKGVSLEEINKYLLAKHSPAYNERMNNINHSVDRSGNIIPYRLQDRASSMSTQDANDYINELTEERKVLLEDIAKKWYAIRDKTQKLLVESGQETQETIDLWNETYPFYVPLNREQEQQAMPAGLRTGSGTDVRGDFSKRATGSEKQVISIADGLLYQRERAIARAENNEVGKSIYRLFLEHPDPKFAISVNPDAIYDREALIAELQQLGYDNAADVIDNIMAEPKEKYLRKVKLSDFVIDPTTGFPIPNTKEVVDARVSRNARFGDNVLTFKMNGHERYVFFDKKNPDAITMIRTLKQLDAQQLGWFLSGNRFITHYLSQVYTVLNPIFSIVNGVKDYPFGMVNLSTTPIRGKQLQVTAKIMPAMLGIMTMLRKERAGGGYNSSIYKWQRIYSEALDAGFQTSNRYAVLHTGEDRTYITNLLDQFKDNNTKQVFRYVINMTYDFASMIENGVRLASYQQMREAGYTPQQSASVAKNLTINFDKKGSRTTILRSLYLFFNASIQGTVRLSKTLKGPSGGRILVGGILLGVIQAVLIAAAGYKDDDPPEYIRSHNLIIPTGDGKYKTIPMPYGLNILPNTGRILTEAAMDINQHKELKDAHIGKHALNWTNALFSTFSPFGNQGLSMNSLIPTSMSAPFAISSQGTNTNAFGQTISKKDSYKRPTPGYMRTKESGTAPGKEFAKWMNKFTLGTDYTKGGWSPTGDDIDFLASTYLGPVLGSINKAYEYAKAKVSGEEVPSYKVPVLGRFQGETDSKPVITSRFYTNLNAMYEHEFTIKNLKNNEKAKNQYYKDHPEARAWRMAEGFDAKINEINAAKKQKEIDGAPQKELQRLDNLKIIQMNKFNDAIEKIRNQ